MPSGSCLQGSLAAGQRLFLGKFTGNQGTLICYSLGHQGVWLALAVPSRPDVDRECGVERNSGILF